LQNNGIIIKNVIFIAENSPQKRKREYMKDLYEILEVSRQASGEVIEKAYKVLAKKYHPDLQSNEGQRKICEQKMKELNEAYEILGDTRRREQYDVQLRAEEVKKVQAEERASKRDSQKYAPPKEQKIETPESIYDVYGQIRYYRDKLQQEAKRQEEMNRQAEVEYQRAYDRYLRSLGWKSKKKWSWRRVRDLLKALGIMALLVLALWAFPPTRNWMIAFYEENMIIKALVDFIGNFFRALAERIG